MTTSPDVAFTLNQLVWFIGGVTAIVVAIKAVIKPFKEIENHGERLNKLEETNEYIAKAVNALVNHAIDGNDISRLKDVRDEYQSKMLNH
jgi:ferritin